MDLERIIPAWLVAAVSVLAGFFIRIIPKMPEQVKWAVAWPFFAFAIWYAIDEYFRFDADIRTIIFRANFAALCIIVIVASHYYVKRAGGYRALWTQKK